MFKITALFFFLLVAYVTPLKGDFGVGFGIGDGYRYDGWDRGGFGVGVGFYDEPYYYAPYPSYYYPGSYYYYSPSPYGYYSYPDYSPGFGVYFNIGN